MKKRNVIVAALLAVAVVGASIGGYYGFRAMNRPVTMVYAVSDLSSGYWGDNMTLDGMITSDASQNIYLSTEQKVKEVLVQEGDTVREGDVLILTKQIGSGIVNTAVKAQLASEESAREVIRVMTSLNKKAKETARKFTVHACTDVTGFGLLGHCSEMAEASGAVIRINVEDVAYMHGVKEYAQMGLIPGGAYRNRKHVAPMLDTGDLEVSGPDEMWLDLLCDPQTSGGLLLAVPEEEAGSMLEEFERTGMETKVSVIGKVLKSGCESGRICLGKGK